jgi:hypothetical protein
LSSTVQSTVQSAVARAGTFKYLLAVIEFQNATADSTITIDFEKNGSSVISTTMTNAVSPNLALESATGVSVVAGDLVNFKFTTSGTVNLSHRGRVYAAVGFLPS